jgi:DnaJ-class molecular chaperone
MAGKDPFQILGVSKTDDIAAIKSAYRKLAMKWHPDRNADPGAKEMFSDISKAWAILESADKRRAFEAGKIDFDGNDLTGAMAGGGNPFTSDQVKDMFRAFDEEVDLDDPALYGGKPKARAASLDLQCRVRVDFVAAATGSIINVRLPNDKQVKVRIKPGVEDGQKLKLKGFGRSAEGQTGDAYIELAVKDHDFFTRSGNDIGLTVPVTLEEVLLQEPIEIPTVHGPLTVTPPLGEAFNKVQRLSGKGIDGGDQLVTYRLVLPERVSDAVREALRAQGPATAAPRRHFTI